MSAPWRVDWHGMVCLDGFMKNPGKISVRITLSTTLLYLEAVLVSIWFKKTNHWFIQKDYWLTSIVLVLVLILGASHHQADACHLASVYLGFRSIWNTHFCLRLQPHLYPSLVATSLGRDIRLNSDISQRMSSPTPPSKTRNYC